MAKVSLECCGADQEDRVTFFGIAAERGAPRGLAACKPSEGRPVITRSRTDLTCSSTRSGQEVTACPVDQGACGTIRITGT